MSIQYSQQDNIKGDSIADLPVDQNPPSPNEIQIIDTLFKNHKSTMEIIMDEAKDSLLVAILVILFCLPQFNNVIIRYIPMTENSIYILLLIKGLMAMLLFWLIKHFYLARKNS